ncbi:MAG: PD40 domain-containing protein [Bryobacteraceae bacterium]|nr:PD40 domain-containing protein [Bryobacteraceae bacterium]
MRQTLLAGLSFQFLTVVLPAQKGSVLPAEKSAYRDPLSGIEVLELTQKGKPDNLYYHFPNFTADGKQLIFADDRGQGSQVYSLDVESGRIRQLTEGEGVSAHSACPHPGDARRLFYLRGPRVFELNPETLAEKQLGEIPAPRAGGYGQPTLSHDGKSLAVAKQVDERQWEVGLMSIETGAYRTVVRTGFRIGHVQHHPSEPVIFYVWETGGYAPQRTWLVNSDGSANRPFYASVDPKKWVTPLKEWVTHESWVRGTGQMTMILDKIGILIVNLDGTSRMIDGDYWHVAGSPDGKKLAADDHRGGLFLIDPAAGSRRLLAAGLRDGDRGVHAHASFSPDGRYLIFNTGRVKKALAWIDLHGLDR